MQYKILTLYEFSRSMILVIPDVIYILIVTLCEFARSMT